MDAGLGLSKGGSIFEQVDKTFFHLHVHEQLNSSPISASPSRGSCCASEMRLEVSADQQAPTCNVETLKPRCTSQGTSGSGPLHVTVIMPLHNSGVIREDAKVHRTYMCIFSCPGFESLIGLHVPASAGWNVRAYKS